MQGVSNEHRGHACRTAVAYRRGFYTRDRASMRAPRRDRVSYNRC